MRFEASVEKDGSKIFEEAGDKGILEILSALDNAIEKEIKGKK